MLISNKLNHIWESNVQYHEIVALTIFYKVSAAPWMGFGAEMECPITRFVLDVTRVLYANDLVYPK